MTGDMSWVKLYRKITEWEYYKDIPTKVLFIHLMIKVNHEEKEWRGIKINRGEVLTSRSKLSHETGLSEQQVRRAIIHLQNNQQITSKTTSRYTVIKLNSYDCYQQNNQHSPSHATTTKEIKNKEIRKNIKKENSEKVKLAPFEEFWKEYPAVRRKGGKSYCKEKWNKLRITQEMYDTLILPALKSDKSSDQWQRGFAPQISTYINKRLWEDYEPVEQKTKIKQDPKLYSTI